MSPHTLAFVESPVQLLNVLEWAHARGLTRGPRSPRVLWSPGDPWTREPTAATTEPPGGEEDTDAGAGTAPGAEDDAGAGTGTRRGADSRTRRDTDTRTDTDTDTDTGADATAAPVARTGRAARPAPARPRRRAAGPGPGPAPGADPTARITVVVLSPADPMTRGQLRRMAELAREEGHEVRWEEARGGTTAPFKTVGGLRRLLRRAERVVMGDPFSRYVQLLLTITKARDLVVVDDGTATMEFVAQLARGERLVRWHRKGGRPSPRDLLFAPVSAAARRRLTPAAGSGDHRVEVFSAMPIADVPDGVGVSVNDFAWTRARFGPPRLTSGADLVGTSLVETGVVDGDRYLDAVRALAEAHGATRYFAHRRESADKLHRLAVETGLEVVRPDLPLELIARRGPIGRTVLSFPSTVVHTLPRALAGTPVRVAVCDIAPGWLTAHASPRAQGFLSGVTGTARDVHRLVRTGQAG